MEKINQKLDSELIDKIKSLNSKKNDLIIRVGQAHLEKKELEKIIELMETDFSKTSIELGKILTELEEKYPNGELDLLEGVVTYEK